MLSTIHPFPARMAPDLARDFLSAIPRHGKILDPMCGSGMVPRVAVEAGLHCTGIDIDPLAVLMSRVWTTCLNLAEFEDQAAATVRAAKQLAECDVEQIEDIETDRFISYWFASRQKVDLARLATILRRQTGPVRDALAIALSRIVVSKEKMASLARDTSHSRPHRVARENNFDVYVGFQRAVRLIANRLRPERILGQASIHLGDARTLENLRDSDYDLILTSPPYLNAIDYMRGHKMALVWLGYKISALREIRAANVGAEKVVVETEATIDISPFVTRSEHSTITNTHLGWVRRYARDMQAILMQLQRVGKPTGQITIILGNSFIRGAKIDNAGIVKSVAEQIGLRFQSKRERKIPARRRYLPPPGDTQNSLDARMRAEAVLTFGLI